MTLNATLVHIVDGNRLLLKKATRGISKDKWNAPGGKIADSETAEQNALREMFEETGMRIKNLFYHGEIKFFLDGRNELSVHGFLFSTREFSGIPKSTEEGEVRWFDVDEIPYSEMWPDDIYWLPLMIQGKRFDADFYFADGNKEIIKHEIRMK
jgi:8-oxo-dGTP pyrophosphatase MutT (NUDIX family)